MHIMPCRHSILKFPLIILLLFLPCIVWAAQYVATPDATPNGIFVNQANVVTVTAQVDSDPNLIVSSVNLVRYDSNKKIVGVVGQLYDDGTHGDKKPGDGIFSGQVTIDEITPTTIYFRVSVAYKGSLVRTLSSFAQVDVVQPLSPQDAQIISDLPTAALHQYQAYISQGLSNLSAKRATLQWILGQPGVSTATLSDSGDSISITYTSGIHGGIFLGADLTH